MTTATVSELKRSISACLRQVKAGEELLITEHGRPVARLLSVKDIASLPESLLDMEKRGLLKRPEKTLSADFWSLPRPADPKATVRSVVLQERREGW